MCVCECVHACVVAGFGQLPPRNQGGRINMELRNEAREGEKKHPQWNTTNFLHLSGASVCRQNLFCQNTMEIWHTILFLTPILFIYLFYLFLLRKICLELTSVSVFLYFVYESLTATAWPVTSCVGLHPGTEPGQPKQRMSNLTTRPWGQPGHTILLDTHFFCFLNANQYVSSFSHFFEQTHFCPLFPGALKKLKNKIGMNLWVKVKQKEEKASSDLSRWFQKLRGGGQVGLTAEWREWHQSLGKEANRHCQLQKKSEPPERSGFGDGGLALRMGGVFALYKEQKMHRSPPACCTDKRLPSAPKHTASRWEAH